MLPYMLKWEIHDDAVCWFDLYVTELSLKCTEPMRVDTTTLGTERLFARVQWNVRQGASSSSEEDFIFQ